MSELSRMLKNLKKQDHIITPRLDEWLTRNDEFILTDEELALLRRLLGEHARRGSRKGTFTGSQAMTCERMQMFKFIGLPERRRVTPVLQHKFIDGTWRHVRWQLLVRRAIPGTDVEFRIDAPQYRFRGAVDLLNTQEGWGGEIKGWSWMGSVNKAGGVLDPHERQAGRYWLATDLFLDEPLDKWVFIYEDKRSQEWKETVVRRTPRIEREVREELERLNEHVEEETLPRVLQECWNKKGAYRECPFARHCLGIDTWQEAQAIAGSVGNGARTDATQRRRGPRKLPHHRP